MKRFISCFVAVLLIVGTASVALAQNRGSSQNPGTGDILGQGKYQSDAHKIFRMVRFVPPTFGGSTTLAADSIVIWDTGNDDGVTITTTTLSSDSRVAGIIVTQALTPEADGNTAVQDRGKQNWTWLQTYGLSQVNVAAAGNPLVGETFGTSTTAGEASMYVPNTTNPRILGVAGFFVDAATGGDNDVEVFITGLD